jgi:Mg-chelatase subunit ChlI
MIQRIKLLLNKDPKVNFFVTCTDQIIENYDHHNVTLLMQAPSQEQIQQEANKKFNLNLDNIIGFDDIKRLMRQVINVHNKKKVNFLIAGYPGTAKTVFLLSAKDELEPQGAKCEYIDCSNLTGAGIMDYILTAYVDEHRKIDYLLLDEIDKVDNRDQKKFLNMLQTGIVKNTKRFDKRETRINFVPIATANDLNRVYKPLFDRFITVYVPKYTKDQFFSIGEQILKKKYLFSEPVAKQIILKVWQADNGSMRRIDDLAILLKAESTDQLKIERLNDIVKTLEDRKLVFTG